MAGSAKGSKKGDKLSTYHYRFGVQFPFRRTSF